MTIPLGMQGKVLEKIQECLVKVLGEDEGVDIKVRYRTDMGGCAGLAYFEERGIEFNAKLFLANTKVFFNEIIPHEVGHILQHILHPEVKRPHGKVWRGIMKVLEATPNTYHHMDVSEVENNYFRYTCACRTHSLSKQHHKHTQLGKPAHCAECSSRLIFFPRGDCFSKI